MTFVCANCHGWVELLRGDQIWWCRNCDEEALFIDLVDAVYVDEPQALQYLADHYYEVPGVWGWDGHGAFVGVRDLDIMEFLDARGITYTTE